MFRSSILISCVFLVSLTPYLTYAMTAEQKEKIKEHFEQIGVGCMKDTPITEEDINNLRNKMMPTGSNAPCFMACMLRNIGVMDDKGILSNEKGLELAKNVFHDAEEVKAIKDYMDSCAHINNEPVSDGEKGCDRAMLSYKCMTENASQFGFDV